MESKVLSMLNAVIKNQEKQEQKLTAIEAMVEMKSVDTVRLIGSDIASLFRRTDKLSEQLDTVDVGIDDRFDVIQTLIEDIEFDTNVELDTSDLMDRDDAEKYFHRVMENTEGLFGDIETSKDEIISAVTHRHDNLIALNASYNKNMRDDIAYYFTDIKRDIDKAEDRILTHVSRTKELLKSVCHSLVNVVSTLVSHKED